MPKINFTDIFQQLKANVLNLAETNVKEFASSAKKDAQKILDTMKSDLKQWAQQLADGEITKKEFEFLVRTEKDSFKMEGLKQKGLAKVEIDKFRNGVINMITDTIFNFI